MCKSHFDTIKLKWVLKSSNKEVHSCIISTVSEIYIQDNLSSPDYVIKFIFFYSSSSNAHAYYALQTSIILF